MLHQSTGQTLTPIFSMHRVTEPGKDTWYACYCACDWWFSHPDPIRAAVELLSHIAEDPHRLGNLSG